MCCLRLTACMSARAAAQFILREVTETAWSWSDVQESLPDKIPSRDILPSCDCLCLGWHQIGCNGNFPRLAGKGRSGWEKSIRTYHDRLSAPTRISWQFEIPLGPVPPSRGPLARQSDKGGHDVIAHSSSLTFQCPLMTLSRKGELTLPTCNQLRWRNHVLCPLGVWIDDIPLEELYVPIACNQRNLFARKCTWKIIEDAVSEDNCFLTFQSLQSCTWESRLHGRFMHSTSETSLNHPYARLYPTHPFFVPTIGELGAADPAKSV